MASVDTIKRYKSMLLNDNKVIKGINNRVVTEITRPGSDQLKQERAGLFLCLACGIETITAEYCQSLITTYNADPNFILEGHASKISCLMFASGLANGMDKIVMLGNSGVNPNYQSPTTNNTALFIALMRNFNRNVEALIQFGADIYTIIQPETNKSILDYVRQTNSLRADQVEDRQNSRIIVQVLQIEQQYLINLLGRETPFTHSFENIQSLYEFLNGPLPEAEASASAASAASATPKQRWESDFSDQMQFFGLGGGSSSRKRRKRRRTKRRKTNKKRRTNRRK